MRAELVLTFMCSCLYRNAVNVAVAVMVAALVASVTAGVSVSRNQSSLETVIPMLCPEKPVFKTGRAIIEFEGFERTLLGNEVKILEEAFTTAYNDVSAGCYDIYQRFIDDSEIVSQNLITDEFGSPILVTEFAATVRCRDCSDREPLFGHNDATGGRFLEATADRFLQLNETSQGNPAPGELSDIVLLDVALALEVIIIGIVESPGGKSLLPCCFERIRGGTALDSDGKVSDRFNFFSAVPSRSPSLLSSPSPSRLLTPSLVPIASSVTSQGPFQSASPPPFTAPATTKPSETSEVTAEPAPTSFVVSEKPLIATNTTSSPIELPDLVPSSTPGPSLLSVPPTPLISFAPSLLSREIFSAEPTLRSKRPRPSASQAPISGRTTLPGSVAPSKRPSQKEAALPVQEPTWEVGASPVQESKTGEPIPAELNSEKPIPGSAPLLPITRGPNRVPMSAAPTLAGPT